MAKNIATKAKKSARKLVTLQGVAGPPMATPVFLLTTITDSNKMDKQDNKYISVAYKLFDITNTTPKLVEETSADKPFVFLSGFGTTLEDFEAQIAPLATGDEFDFTLTPDRAYGEYVDARVIDLDKEMFCVDGRFDSQHIYPDAIIPLQNEDGNRFLGRVLSIGDSKVKVDLNHPLAGKTLNFKGQIRESRLATNSEIEQMARMLSGEGGCGGCGGGCGNCGDGGCGHCGDGCGK